MLAMERQVQGWFQSSLRIPKASPFYSSHSEDCSFQHRTDLI